MPLLSRLSAPAAYWLGLAAITVAGLLLFAHGTASVPLNYDEGATLYFAHLPLADLFGPPARLETNPPLFYATEHVWLALAGHSAFALRLPSVLAAALCIPLAAALARAIGSPKAGLAAAALVATSPAHLAAAQDGRTYAVLALATLALLAAALALADRTTAGRWLAALSYALAGMTAVLLHDTAILFVDLLALATLSNWRPAPGEGPRFMREWVAPNLAVALVFLFWLPIILHQFVHVLAHFWLPVPTLTDLRYAVLNSIGQPYVHVGQPAVDLLYVVTGVAGLALHRRRPALVAAAALLVIGLPCASWAVSQWRPIMNGKTLECLVPIFLVFVALGATQMPRLALPVTACLVALQLLGCFNFFITRPDEAYPQVAALLRAQTRPGDVLYTDPASNRILLRYYGFAGTGMAIFAPAGADPWYRAGGFTVLAPDNVASRLGQAPRLWVLTRTGAAAHATLERSLSATMTEKSFTTFGSGRMRNLRLSLFERGRA